MNKKLLELFPKEKDLLLICAWLNSGRESDAYLDGYNTALEDCITALSKHDIGIVPTEEKLKRIIYSKCVGPIPGSFTTYGYEIHPDKLVEIIRQLMLGEEENETDKV